MYNFGNYDSNLSDNNFGFNFGYGYIDDLINPDDFILNEIADNFTLRFITKLLITTGGNYIFQMP